MITIKVTEWAKSILGGDLILDTDNLEGCHHVCEAIGPASQGSVSVGCEKCGAVFSLTETGPLPPTNFEALMGWFENVDASRFAVLEVHP